VSISTAYRTSPLGAFVYPPCKFKDFFKACEPTVHGLFSYLSRRISPIYSNTQLNSIISIRRSQKRYKILSAEDVRGRGMYIEVLAERLEASKNGKR